MAMCVCAWEDVIILYILVVFIVICFTWCTICHNFLCFQDLGTQTTVNNMDVIEKADIIFLCVKPHILPGVLDGIHKYSPDKLYVSVAAGVTIQFMEEVGGDFLLHCV